MGPTWPLVAVGAGLLLLPAWMSVRCLFKARQLLRWRRPSLKGLDGQVAAVRGEVRVRKPVNGDCLWHREIVQVLIPSGKGQMHTKTVSDISRKADFSIVIEGRDYEIADLPTRVYGSYYRRENNRISKWLPVVDYLTVLGRVRQKGLGWEIVRDDKVGLVYSLHPAEKTAFREIVKAALGLAVVALGVFILYDVVTR